MKLREPLQHQRSREPTLSEYVYIMIRILGIALFATALAASAQTDPSLTKPVTDEQKIADALRAGPLTGVRPLIETYPLDKAADAYAHFLSGNAQFRVVLTT